LETPIKVYDHSTHCKIDGCTNPRLKGGFCNAHYKRMKRNRPMYIPAKATTAERFWAKVDTSGGPDACWLWIPPPQKSGYGNLSIKSRMVPAHRISWELHNGPIPKTRWGALCVCHACDVRRCVNPAHLFLGTRADNNIDREMKGRGNHARGANHPRAKLREEDIPAIRARIATGEPQSRIAADYGVHVGTISMVKNGHAWRHID
jgi:hypothetical protein